MRDGWITINATDSNPATADEEAIYPGATEIINTVSLTIRVRNSSNNPIGNVSCAVFDASTHEELMNTDSNAVTGDASASYNYTGDTAIYWRVRESPAAGSRYIAQSGLNTIRSTGLDVTVVLAPDPLA
jgi:hypothetical protein